MGSGLADVYRLAFVRQMRYVGRRAEDGECIEKPTEFVAAIRSCWEIPR